MKNIARSIKHEIEEAIPPMVFFFFLFHLLSFTKIMMLEGYGMTVATATIATVSALIAAKAVLIAGQLPLINRFDGRPLVLGVLWKAFWYWLLCVVFRSLEEILPRMFRGESPGEAARGMMAELTWPHFWIMQTWLLVGLLAYTSISELNRYLGEGRMRAAFLGK